MSDEKKTPTSDDIRDALAEVLFEGVTKGVETVVENKDGAKEVIRVKPNASFLNVVVNYLKNNPPATVPSANSTTGLLKEHVKELQNAGVLPFPSRKAN